MTLIETIDRIRELRAEADCHARVDSQHEAETLLAEAKRMESDMHRRIGWPS